MRAVFNGALRDFRFVKDPVGWQLLQPPGGIVDTRNGNCASLNLVLLPSLLGSIGYPSRAVTIKADPDRPSEFSHVYIEAQTSDGQWTPFDIARSNPQFGVAPDADRYWAIKRWPLTGGASSGRLAGLQNFFFGDAGDARFGMGIMPTVKVRVRSRFPRRGMGQDDWSSSIDLTGGSTFDPTQVYTPPAATIGTFNPLQTASGGVSLASAFAHECWQLHRALKPARHKSSRPTIRLESRSPEWWEGREPPLGTSTGSSGKLALLLVAAGIAFAIFAGK